MTLASVRFARSGLVIEVRSWQQSDLDWLAECLAPGFSTVTGIVQSDWEISVVLDESAYRGLLEFGPLSGRGPVHCFSFDSQVAQHQVWNDEPLTVHDSEFRLFYRVWSEERRIEVLAGAPLASLRVALLRLVREIFTQHLVRQGHVQFHGAAVGLAGYGLLICGPKRAGKTSLTVDMLRDPSARFISNDRALVACHTQIQPEVTGMPTVISIRPGTLALFRDLPWSKVRHWRARQRLSESLAINPPASVAATQENLDMNPAQFCYLLGTEPVAGAPLRAVIFPRVEPAAVGVEWRTLDASEMVVKLETNLLLTTDSVFTTSLGPRPAPDLTQSTLRRVTSRIAGFEVVLGDGAYRGPSIASSLQELL